jgi:hypothetical protein
VPRFELKALEAETAKKRPAVHPSGRSGGREVAPVRFGRPSRRSSGKCLLIHEDRLTACRD